MQKRLYKSLGQIAGEEEAERRRLRQEKLLHLTTDKQVKSTTKAYDKLELKQSKKKSKKGKKKPH